MEGVACEIEFLRPTGHSSPQLKDHCTALDLQVLGIDVV